MAGDLKNVRVVNFKEAHGRYEKGEHAMHVTLAEKLKKRGAKIEIKKAKEEYEKRLEDLKEKKAKSEAKENI